MSKIAFIDRWADLHSVVHRCQQDGALVRYCVRTSKPENARIGDGIVAKVKSLDALLRWRPDALVAYQSPDEAATARAEGIPTWGSSETSRLLEEDRVAALRLARASGLSVSTTREFTSMDAAYAFLASTPIEGWVFKAEGADNACDSTRVCESKDAAFAALESASTAKNFVLQEIVKGVEVSTEGWFDHRVGWLHPFNSTLERKRLMAGDVGPNVGCMGSIVWAWPDDARLPREVLLPHTAYLDRARYVGPFDVNSIIGRCSLCGHDHEPDTPHWLEYSPRLGWNAFEALMVGMPEGALADFIVALAHGDATTVPFTRKDYAAAVRVYTKKSPNVPLIAPWRANPHVFIKDVYFDGRTLRTTGTDTDCGFTVVFEVAATGSTVWDATRAIYKQHLPKLTVPSPTYRTDIGEHAQQDLYQLDALGYGTLGTPTTEAPSPAMPAVALERASRSA